MTADVRAVLRFAALAVTILALTFYADDASTVLSHGITVTEFDFDDGIGGPDPQGWRPLHRWDSEQAYFHVEDFSGAGHLAAPMEGNRSMWCGMTAEDPRSCHWSAPPGYGSNWSEALTSAEFAVQGDVTLDFLVNMELEPGYDFMSLEYEGTAGNWVNLDTYNCGFQICGPELKSYIVPAAAHDGTIRFHFSFESDGAGDNEGTYNNIFEKAFLIDSLTIADNGGVVDYQDYESEAVGDSVTSDGDWTAAPISTGHNGGFLVDGNGVLQESVTQNDTYFWAFYDGSTQNYGCAGYPGQLVVPTTRSITRSPLIDITHDSDGNPIDGDIDSLEVSFDVYRDIDPAHLKAYVWFVWEYSDDCLLANTGNAGANGNQKDWYRHTFRFVPAEGTTRIAIELGVENYSYTGSDCRSHSPLIDNVSVKRYGGTVSAVKNPGVSSRLALHQNHPNPFNPTTTIGYEVPAGAERVTLKVYDVAGRLVRTLVDRPAHAAGPASATWDGRNQRGERAVSGVYFYELTAGTARETRRMVLLK